MLPKIKNTNSTKIIGQSIFQPDYIMRLKYTNAQLSCQPSARAVPLLGKHIADFVGVPLSNLAQGSST
jgi:hypothetical protein